MQIKIKPNTFFVFDLDDTLFPEIDYLRSAFSAMAAKLAPLIGTDIYAWMCQQYNNGENVFRSILQQYGQCLPGITIETLIKEYREHLPNIQLNADAAGLLARLKSLAIPAGLITDGRSITQRNKLKALQLESYFSDVIISEEFGSEKPNERNYRYFGDKYPRHEFYYFGDNTSKDFIAPIRLGWFTACLLDKGTHIHAQSFTGSPLPTYLLNSFDEIQLI